MSTKGQEPLESVPRSKSKRRMVKGALLVFGAGMLIQPAGGVLGSAQDAPKKEEPAAVSKSQPATSTVNKTTGAKKKSKGHHKKQATPKKEGS